jgi:hypothetical protein
MFYFWAINSFVCGTARGIMVQEASQASRTSEHAMFFILRGDKTRLQYYSLPSRFVMWNMKDKR